MTMQLIVLVFVTFIYVTRSNDMFGLDAIPERTQILYANPKYVYNASFTVRKYSRRGNYMINLSGNLKHSWNNNVSVDFVFKEFLHNEYKNSFIELNFKVCDLLDNDELIGAVLRSAGLKCPLPAGYNHITNVTLHLPKFPYVFPFQKGRAEITLKTEPKHEVIGAGYLYLTFKVLKKKS